MKTKSGLPGICLLGILLPPAELRGQFISATNNGALVITGYAGPGGSVTIPGASNGLPVVIGDYAFFYQSTLTNLTIMDGVRDIGTNAFSGCVNLTGVAIPGSVTNIRDYAFNYCPSLTNVMLSSGVANLAEGAFRLTMIENIIIPAVSPTLARAHLTAATSWPMSRSRTASKASGLMPSATAVR